MITNKKIAEKIKHLRTDSGLSQAEFGKKIHLSRVAISDIENGRRAISALEIANISQSFDISTESLLRNEEPVKISASHFYSEVFFDPKKLKNTLLYILENCGGKPNVGETVIYKLLYFIDFNYYELTGKSITGLTYIKLQYGPVPASNQYSHVTIKMIKQKELNIIRQNYYNKQQKKYIALIESNIEIFSPNELKTIDKVVHQLSGMSAKQIETYVHNDTPWKISKMKEPISYHLVSDRTPAFAQLNQQKLWQNASGSDILQALDNISDEEYQYYENLS